MILEDGTVFHGYSFGSKKAVTGEVVFNTGMVGYPESLTDPSYRGQILVLTYPLIGNYGIPDNEKEDNLLKFFESDNIKVQGLIISDYSHNYSHWNAKKMATFSDCRRRVLPPIFRTGQLDGGPRADDR